MRDLGAALLAEVDLDAVAARLSRLPTAALLDALEGVVATLDNADPARRRKRAGVLGRLLGRDLVAQAQPDPVENRIRLQLAGAQALAVELAEGSDALAALSAHLQRQTARLDELLAGERLADTEADAAHRTVARQRRLEHLDAIAASWRATVAQIAVVRDHAALLLDRHAQVRDLLTTLWRQRAAATAAAAQLAADPGNERRLRTLLRAQLIPLRASALQIAASPSADIERPSKEPTP
ncbi:hypothetical protein [Luteimonas aquatica]|uniref:hypothetical protein n=1 Tax=Luteimonas aquatica TaxID=450364 RepID=UPI001F589055|nr:hypothetical protein [Luteimonas aquatica]